MLKIIYVMLRHIDEPRLRNQYNNQTMDWSFSIRFPAEDRDFSPRQVFRPALGLIQPLIQCVPGLEGLLSTDYTALYPRR
jgi:hypothetical protein